MQRPCPIIIDDCPGVDSPVTNTSSEAPDPVLFYGEGWTPYNPYVPPALGQGATTPVNQSADGWSNTSQNDANNQGNQNARGGGSATTRVTPWTWGGTASGSGDNFQQQQPTPPHFGGGGGTGETPVAEPSITPPEHPFWSCSGEALDEERATYAVEGAGAAPFTLSLYSGTLPPGTSLVQTGSRSAYLSGAPTTPGVYTYTIIAIRPDLPTVFALVTDELWVFGLTETTMPNATIGTAYYAQLMTGGGSGAIVFEVVDPVNLPPGVTMGDDGLFEGTPGGPAQDYNFYVKITDDEGGECTQALTITVANCAWITDTELPNGIVGHAYAEEIPTDVVGVTFALTVPDSLPAGITLEPDGTVTGTPQSAGTWEFDVTMTDGDGNTCTQECSVSIACFALAITNDSTLDAGATGNAYSVQLACNDATPAYFWTVSDGTIPPGLAMSAAGLISGVPTTAGDYIFTAKVSDIYTGGCSATKEFTVSIANSLTGWAAIEPNLIVPSGCTHLSGSPAWGGVFDQWFQNVNPTIYQSYWYFNSKSLKGRAVAFDEYIAPDHYGAALLIWYPDSIIFPGTNFWVLDISCIGYDTFWNGWMDGGSISDPTGIYTYLSGSSGGLAQIKVESDGSGGYRLTTP